MDRSGNTVEMTIEVSLYVTEKEWEYTIRTLIFLVTKVFPRSWDPARPPEVAYPAPSDYASNL